MGREKTTFTLSTAKNPKKSFSLGLSLGGGEVAKEICFYEGGKHLQNGGGERPYDLHERELRKQGNQRGKIHPKSLSRREGDLASRLNMN